MKPVKHKEDIAGKCLGNIEKLSNDFSAKNVVASRSELFQRVIENNASEWQQIVTKKGKNPSIEAGDCPGDNVLTVSLETLKSLLQTSDGVFVENFLESEAKVAKSLDDLNDLVKKHVYLEWTFCLEQVVRSAIRDSLGLIKTPQY